VRKGLGYLLIWAEKSCNEGSRADGGWHVCHRKKGR
jgi:hypothetical protein